MDTGLVHLEVLGPRVGLDAWLSTLQAAGSCHLADALAGLSGEAGIGRPRPRAEERRAAELRAPALEALRALAGVLPAGAAAPTEPEPAGWSLPPGGVDEEALAARAERALALASRVRRELEAARGAERAVDELERARAAWKALAALGSVTGTPSVFTHLGSGAQRLARRLAARGVRSATGASGAQEALALAEPPDRAAEDALARAGLERQLLDPGPAGRAPTEALADLEPRLRTAVTAEAVARAALAARLAGDGEEARRALDGLEDAEARDRAQRLLASTGHVTAARVYVARRQQRELLELLERRHGAAVLARALTPGDDAPGPVRPAAASPLAALGDLAPARFGERAARALPLLLAVLLAAYLVGDAALGLLLLVGGLALRRGQGRGTPRRDAARLASAAGLAALLAGLLAGRAGGSAGAQVWGTGWGLAPSAVPGTWADAWEAYLVAVAVGVLALGLYALALVVRHGLRHDAARLASSNAALRRLVLLTFLALYAAGRGQATPTGVAVAYLIALALLVPGRELVALTLDVLATARGLAVVAGAAFGAAWALSMLCAPGWPLAISTLLAAAAVLVLEVSASAMGSAYEHVLGGRSAAPAFAPFARQGLTPPGLGEAP